MADRKRHWLCRPAFRPTRRRNGLSGRGGAAGRRQLLSVLPASLAEPAATKPAVAVAAASVAVAAAALAEPAATKPAVAVATASVAVAAGALAEPAAALTVAAVAVAVAWQSHLHEQGRPEDGSRGIRC